ncbi:MAG TPA: transposase [Myxococcales bacterium]|jgi:REP element-mobilizing transposase RayT|nr:transposase [Myxococcales bacterium]
MIRPLPQASFQFETQGGKRRGAGRHPTGRTALVSHQERPRFDKPTPAHVTLRIKDDVPSLRSSRRFAVIRRCFADARGRNGLRLVEFTVLSNHLHLIVEADTSRALSRGVQGLCIRLAKRLNAALRGRRGRIFADHYHSHLLRTPAETRNALNYVSTNAERHYGDAGPDDFSSRNPVLRELLVAPGTWLLNAGWKLRKQERPRTAESVQRAAHSRRERV